MAARGSATDADAVRVDAIVFGVQPNKADGTVHVGNRFRNREPRLAPMADGEDRVATLQQRVGEHGAKAVILPALVGEPTAAEHDNDPSAVGILLWRVDIQRQGHAELAAAHAFRPALYKCT